VKSHFDLNLKSQFLIFDIFRDIRVHIYVFEVCGRFGALMGVANLFLGQSTGIDKTNTLHYINIFYLVYKLWAPKAWAACAANSAALKATESKSEIPIFQVY